jgi:hypothetical protein
VIIVPNNKLSNIVNLVNYHLIGKVIWQFLFWFLCSLTIGPCNLHIDDKHTCLVNHDIVLFRWHTYFDIYDRKWVWNKTPPQQSGKVHLVGSSPHLSYHQTVCWYRCRYVYHKLGIRVGWLEPGSTCTQLNLGILNHTPFRNIWRFSFVLNIAVFLIQSNLHLLLPCLLHLWGKLLIYEHIY